MLVKIKVLKVAWVKDYYSSPHVMISAGQLM